MEEQSWLNVNSNKIATSAAKKFLQERERRYSIRSQILTLLELREIYVYAQHLMLKIFSSCCTHSVKLCQNLCGPHHIKIQWTPKEFQRGRDWKGVTQTIWDNQKKQKYDYLQGTEGGTSKFPFLSFLVANRTL